jgi:hypothetical protein
MYSKVPSHPLQEVLYVFSEEPMKSVCGRMRTTSVSVECEKVIILFSEWTDLGSTKMKWYSFCYKCKMCSN